MSRKTIAVANIILTIQLNHLIFIAAAVSLLGLLGMQNSHLLLWIAAGIVPLIMYVWRIKAQKIPVFFAGMLGIFVAGLFLPMEIIAKLIFAVMLLMYSILSVRKKLTEMPEKEDLISPFIFVALIGAMAIKNHIHTGVCTGIAWVYLVGYFLYHFVTVYLDFVMIQENSASNMPEKELFAQGIKQVGIFSGIVIFFAALTSTNWITKTLSLVGGWVKAFFRYVFAGIGGAIEEESAPSQPIVDAGQDNLFDPVEYSELWLLIRKIFDFLYEVLVVVIFVAVIYFGIRSLIRFVKLNFTNVGKKAEAKTILSNQDIRESCYAESTKKEKKTFLGFLSSEQRIRSLYKKRVLQEKAKIVGEGSPSRLTYLTAKECCDKLEAEELKNVYEKVRYSDDKVTSEDVRRAKG